MQGAQHRHCQRCCQRCRHTSIQKGTHQLFIIHCKCFTIEINSNRSSWDKSYKRALTATTNHEKDNTRTYRWHKPFWNLYFQRRAIWIAHKYIYGWCDEVWTKEFSFRCDKIAWLFRWHLTWALSTERWAASFSIYSVRHMLEHEWFETRHHYSKLMSFGTITNDAATDVLIYTNNTDWNTYPILHARSKGKCLRWFQFSEIFPPSSLFPQRWGHSNFWCKILCLF